MKKDSNFFLSLIIPLKKYFNGDESWLDKIFIQSILTAINMFLQIYHQRQKKHYTYKWDFLLTIGLSANVTEALTYELS